MSPFKRPSARYGHTPPAETPYQAARQEWDARIGAPRVQARNWRLMAFGELAIIAALSAVEVWQASHSGVTPWVVQIDRLGQPQAVGPAVADYHPSDPQIAWQLARFIEWVRAIPADPIVVRQNWLRAYDFTTDKGAVALNDYARTNDPFAKIGKVQVAVDVSSVIRASPNSFQVAWTEHRFEDGVLVATERWSAFLTVVVSTPADADHLRRNPLGVYVAALNWSRELGQ